MQEIAIGKAIFINLHDRCSIDFFKIRISECPAVNIFYTSRNGDLFQILCKAETAGGDFIHCAGNHISIACLSGRIGNQKLTAISGKCAAIQNAQIRISFFDSDFFQTGTAEEDRIANICNTRRNRDTGKAFCFHKCRIPNITNFIAVEKIRNNQFSLIRI